MQKKSSRLGWNQAWLYVIFLWISGKYWLFCWHNRSIMDQDFVCCGFSQNVLTKVIRDKYITRFSLSRVSPPPIRPHLHQVRTFAELLAHQDNHDISTRKVGKDTRNTLPSSLTWHWKITIYNRKYIFIHGGFYTAMLVFRGSNPTQLKLEQVAVEISESNDPPFKAKQKRAFFWDPPALKGCFPRRCGLNLDHFEPNNTVLHYINFPITGSHPFHDLLNHPNLHPPSHPG